MKIGPDGKAPYKNILDCLGKVNGILPIMKSFIIVLIHLTNFPYFFQIQTVKQAGVAGLWIGLPTYISRVSPHAIAVKIPLSQIFIAQKYSDSSGCLIFYNCLLFFRLY